MVVEYSASNNYDTNNWGYRIFCISKGKLTLPLEESWKKIS